LLDQTALPERVERFGLQHTPVQLHDANRTFGRSGGSAIASRRRRSDVDAGTNKRIGFRESLDTNAIESGIHSAVILETIESLATSRPIAVKFVFGHSRADGATFVEVEPATRRFRETP